MDNGSTDVLSALIGALATLVAAGLAAVVAAVVFTIGETTKIRQAKHDRQVAAIEQLLSAWADVAAVSAPRIRHWWSTLRVYPERVDVSVATAKLAAVLPRRDFELITLQRQLNDELVRARDDRGRTAVSARAAASLVIWLASRRRGRRHARWQLTERDVTLNFDGSKVRLAKKPGNPF